MGAKTSNIRKGQNNRSDGHLLEYFRNTFVRGGSGGAVAAVFSATGGTLVQSGGYNYHVFTQPDIFSVTNTTGVGVTMTSLVVGGGGGTGGGDFIGRAGYGGAGGVAQFTYIIKNSSDIPVTVGSGGGPGSNGNPSILDTTSVIGYAATAFGGGSGGAGLVSADIPAQAGSPGGSGGGGGGSAFPSTSGVLGSAQTVTIPVITIGVGVATYKQGNPGGDGPLGSGGGAGGAGGAGAGVPGTSAPFSNFPGPVISPAIPAPVRPSWTPFVGPTGLFGQGGPTTGGAIDYTGTGGGNGSSPPRNGGSGIVIIRYLTP